jgi:hypothetical protein
MRFGGKQEKLLEEVNEVVGNASQVFQNKALISYNAIGLACN